MIQVVCLLCGFLIVFVAAWPSIIHVFRKFTASKYDPQIQEYDQKFQSSIPIPIKYFSVKKLMHV